MEMSLGSMDMPREFLVVMKSHAKILLERAESGYKVSDWREIIGGRMILAMNDANMGPNLTLGLEVKELRTELTHGQFRAPEQRFIETKPENFGFFGLPGEISYLAGEYIPLTRIWSTKRAKDVFLMEGDLESATHALIRIDFVPGELEKMLRANESGEDAEKDRVLRSLLDRSDMDYQEWKADNQPTYMVCSLVRARSEGYLVA